MKNEKNFFGVELIVLFLSAFACNKRVLLKRTIYQALLNLQATGQYSTYFENYSLPAEIQAGIDDAFAAGVVVNMEKGAFKVTPLNAQKMAEIIKNKITVGYAILLQDFIRDVKKNEYE